MPTTPLHHALARMPRALFDVSNKSLPKPVIRTRDDIEALGDMFYHADLEFTVPSHEILRDRTIARAAVTRIALHILSEGYVYYGRDLEKQQVSVWGSDCRYTRTEETLLLLAEAIAEGRVQASRQLRGTILHLLDPDNDRWRTLVGERLFLGARAALAAAVQDPSWGVPTEHLEIARGRWENALPILRAEQAAEVEAAALAEQEHADPDRPTPPLWSLATPYDTTGGTATPPPAGAREPWLAPDSHRTLSGWRRHGLALTERPITTLRMLARDDDARREIRDALLETHPGRTVAIHIGLGGAPLASENPFWEELTERLTGARRAADALGPLDDFAAAVAAEPATLPTSVYHAALSVCRRFTSQKLPMEILYVFPLTRANSPLWWELYFHVIETSFTTHRTERVRYARLAQQAQRLAHPELDDVLQTPPAAIAAGSRAMTDRHTALDLAVGFALHSPVVAAPNPTDDRPAASMPRSRS